MIGQEGVRKKIDTLVESTKLPGFMLIVGSKGSGKKTLTSYIHSKLPNYIFQERSISVEDIRNTIQEAYRLVGVSAVYVFPDGDTMSPAAKNALLKILEEPPKNAHFIMTLEDVSNTLPTVISRAFVLETEPYTSDQIIEYYKGLPDYNQEYEEIIRNLCQTPGEVNVLTSGDPVQFDDYIKLVVDNIADVEPCNALKISSQVALKPEQEGYDLKLFFKAIMHESLIRLEENPLKYSYFVSTTSKYLRQCGIKGVAKGMLFDNWVLEMGKVEC